MAPSPLPDPDPARKPSRTGLYAPFLLALVVSIVWSGMWIWLRGETIRQMDATAAALRQAGYGVEWRERKVTGWPFRLDVTLKGVSLREPSGWGLTTPKLEGEAFAYALKHWMFATEDGFTLIRPNGGPVEVRGRVIRASLKEPERRPPALSVEGLDLTFHTAPGAKPLSLASAERVELHLRPGPDDQGAILFKVENGLTAPGSTLAAIPGDSRVTLTWDAILSRVSRFQGATLAEAGQAWALAGGTLQVRQAQVRAGDSSLGAQSGALVVDPDGYLAGTLEVTVTKGPEALAGLAKAGRVPPAAALGAAAVMVATPKGKLPLSFEAGRTRVGPVGVAPAPKLW